MKKLLLALFSLLLLLAGCSNNNMGNEKRKEKLDVYTTVYPLRYFTEQIGGDFVNVKSIYPPGADEHTYEPSQKDMMNLADADLFFYIGLGLEGFADKAKTVLKNDHVQMIAIGEEINLEPTIEDEHAGEDHEHAGHNHGDIDPHIWIDPIYAKEMAKKILDSLSEQIPEQRELFEKNYATLAIQFDEIDTQFKELAENAARKKFIIAHAAYGYWENRYNLKQIPISGISSSQEPSQKKLKNIVDTVKSEQIPYILYEQNINSRLADVIRQETGTEALRIHNLAVLTEDELNKKETYFTLMKNNIKVLEKALQ
ncbi:metal ABC transporter substrate-binding protein [Lederbergia lenta]|uniref:Metal ion ABC transporter periplasmic protein n=1 Tax=Lederbergia lenta TaxID=1467 RepID=A0A2X4WDW3_LEDLE|nr:metal ABC transporter substrate-binding protein [Lederbergia lenta]MCM3113437.1 metal ABC transporter substrate-binding protein [Lederbergia lenta]MEC2326418.1 metal ABC transporter substrate-binding protein [Lederbergia lenta]SQI61371.1 metal ion ABC transporter periplasmic protein [Lederbergia lenta]